MKLSYKPRDKYPPNTFKVTVAEPKSKDNKAFICTALSESDAIKQAEYEYGFSSLIYRVIKLN